MQCQKWTLLNAIGFSWSRCHKIHFCNPTFSCIKINFVKTVIFLLFDLLTLALNIVTCSIPHLKLSNITYRMVYSLLRCEPYKRREVCSKILNLFCAITFETHCTLWIFFYNAVFKHEVLHRRVSVRLTSLRRVLRCVHNINFSVF